VATLLQLGLRLTLLSALQLPDPVCTSGPSPSPAAAPSPGATPAQWPPAGPPSDADVSVSELGVFHVSGLAGQAAAACLSVSLQGATLLGGPARACLLHAPAGGAAAAAVDLLHLAGPPAAAAGAAAGATAMSLLLRGVSVALDPGHLSLTWPQQLLARLQPAAGPGPGAGAAAPAPTAPPPGPFSLNVQDLALRYEPGSALGVPRAARVPARPSARHPAALCRAPVLSP
jgi:hypothetical protein